MEMLSVSNILFQIDAGVLALPKFQRPYVWKRDDVRELMLSLYRGYPVGNLLVWDTTAHHDDVKGRQKLAAGVNKLLLDGQQRVTSLYGIIRGEAPAFSDADPKAFLRLYFNVEEEVFEFQSSRMRNDPLWVSVTELMQAKQGAFDFTHRFPNHKQYEYVSRLSKITQLMNKQFYVDRVSAEDMKLDDVVEIFNKVNSGGRTLSKGDLALAKISAYWPQAREAMQARFNAWQSNGYSINDYQYKFDWLLRCINAILTGHSDFAELDRHDFTASDIKDGLKRACSHIDSALNLFNWRLGLDHRQVLGSPNALAAVVRFLDKLHADPIDSERDKLLYWYVHAMLWGRYSGTVETAIRQDLQAIDDGGVDALIGRLRHFRGSLKVEPHDLDGYNRGDRFYSLLYMLTRVYGTCDLSRNIGLSTGMYGDAFRLELHHIFPKSKLRAYGYLPQKEANAVANFTFLFKKTNREISAKLPESYFPHYESMHPGVLKSHWIPMDEQLWKIENYREFLVERRKLLAAAANDFLNELYHGSLPVSPAAKTIDRQEIETKPVSVESDEEESVLQEAMQWMEYNSLPRGEFGYELHDNENVHVATLDLAWPLGVKEGISQRVALLIDEEPETLAIANANGYRYFTTLPQLQRYVLRDILGEPAM